MKEADTDETFSKLMSNSKLIVPFTDFDDKVMGLIEKNALKKASISRDLKLAWVFFSIGSSFGIVITLILTSIQKAIFGIQLDNLRLPFLIIFSFLILSQLDSLIDFYKIQKKQTKR
jgi:hypothetical protein